MTENTIFGIVDLYCRWKNKIITYIPKFSAVGAGTGTKVPVLLVKLRFFVSYILVKTRTKYYDSTVLKRWQPGF